MTLIIMIEQNAIFADKSNVIFFNDCTRFDCKLESDLFDID